MELSPSCVSLLDAQLPSFLPFVAFHYDLNSSTELSMSTKETMKASLGFSLIKVYCLFISRRQFVE